MCSQGDIFVFACMSVENRLEKLAYCVAQDQYQLLFASSHNQYSGHLHLNQSSADLKSLLQVVVY